METEMEPEMEQKSEGRYTAMLVRNGTVTK